VSAGLGSGSRMALVVARQAVIRDLVPGRSRGDEGVELRPDARLAVKRAEADRDFLAFRPLRAEQARAADRAEGLHTASVRPEDADQLLTGEQAESLARDAPLRSAEDARVLSAARAVAVIGPAERRRHLEADTAAEARAVERVLGTRLSGHVRCHLRSFRRQLSQVSASLASAIGLRRATKSACSDMASRLAASVERNDGSGRIPTRGRSRRPSSQSDEVSRRSSVALWENGSQVSDGKLRQFPSAEWL
jgi:hypothetical protein